MTFIADLHIHSPYARAVSKEMIPENLHRWAQLKGLTVIGSGDFTHPTWLTELQDKLEPAEPGLFRLHHELASQMDAKLPERCRAPMRFMLTAEISCIYRRGGRTRKVHNLILAPSFNDVANIIARLSKIGNLQADGRPILGLDSEELLRILLETAPEALLIPAHVWTPHFSVFGANSGFDSLEECFGELTPHIKAIETGLSSDPPMNWRLSQLEGISLVSNSDAHSPGKLGREANVLATPLSYYDIVDAFVSGDPNRFIGTIELFPEEGKYHYDGHRNCGTRLSPAESNKYDLRCPECGKPVTVGVMHRVSQLTDLPEGHKPYNALPYWNLIPLAELIARISGVGVNTKSVTTSYFSLLERLGNELFILMQARLAEIESAGNTLLAKAVQRMRTGKIQFSPGYDGEYGTLQLFDERENEETEPIMSLL